jgi:lipopolysaccharide export LptBFGC system permease protein LptF
MARNGQLPPVIAIWAPIVLFTIVGFESLRRNWN